MGTETNIVEYEPAEAETDLETQRTKKERKAKLDESSEIQWGVRALMTCPLPACEKIDRIFGSGGEAIIHHMWFASGQSLLSSMIKSNPTKSLEELLKALIDAQPQAGWGKVSIKINRVNSPLVDIAVVNPPVKTVKGSQKYLIGSFWAGVFSRYFNRQLICKGFTYNAEKDEFSCTITI